jgi:hypothetical protein
VLFMKATTGCRSAGWKKVRNNELSPWSAATRRGIRPVDRATGGGRSSQKTTGAGGGQETIRILLLSHDLKPWREENVVRAELHKEYIAKIVDVSGNV